LLGRASWLLIAREVLLCVLVVAREVDVDVLGEEVLVEMIILTKVFDFRFYEFSSIYAADALVFLLLRRISHSHRLKLPLLHHGADLIVDVYWPVI